jgi:hypothetical protein
MSKHRVKGPHVDRLQQSKGCAAPARCKLCPVYVGVWKDMNKSLSLLLRGTTKAREKSAVVVAVPHQIDGFILDLLEPTHGGNRRTRRSRG